MIDEEISKLKTSLKALRELRAARQQILLNVSDGPEGIRIYASEDEGVVDWSNTFPAVYVEISINGASAKFGPFQMGSIYQELTQQIRPLPQHPIHEHRIPMDPPACPGIELEDFL